MNEEMRQDALAFLQKLMIDADVEEWHNAGSAIVVTYEPEFGSYSYTGPFASIPEAMKYAENHQAELNSGLADGDEPWVSTVQPMWAPDQESGNLL